MDVEPKKQTLQASQKSEQYTTLDLILALLPIPVIGDMKAAKVCRVYEAPADVLTFTFANRTALYLIYFQLSCLAIGLYRYYTGQ